MHIRMSATFGKFHYAVFIHAISAKWLWCTWHTINKIRLLVALGYHWQPDRGQVVTNGNLFDSRNVSSSTPWTIPLSCCHVSTEDGALKLYRWSKSCKNVSIIRRMHSSYSTRCFNLSRFASRYGFKKRTMMGNNFSFSLEDGMDCFVIFFRWLFKTHSVPVRHL